MFDYTQVIFAALLGMIFLHETPVLLSVIGYVIIIGMAVIRWYAALMRDKREVIADGTDGKTVMADAMDETKP